MCLATFTVQFPPPSIRLLISENLEDAHDFLYKFNFNFM